MTWSPDIRVDWMGRSSRQCTPLRLEILGSQCEEDRADLLM